MYDIPTCGVIQPTQLAASRRRRNLVTISECLHLLSSGSRQIFTAQWASSKNNYFCTKNVQCRLIACTSSSIKVHMHAVLDEIRTNSAHMYLVLSFWSTWGKKTNGNCIYEHAILTSPGHFSQHSTRVLLSGSAQQASQSDNIMQLSSSAKHTHVHMSSPFSQQPCVHLCACQKLVKFCLPKALDCRKISFWFSCQNT